MSLRSLICRVRDRITSRAGWTIHSATARLIAVPTMPYECVRGMPRARNNANETACGANATPGRPNESQTSTDGSRMELDSRATNTMTVHAPAPRAMPSSPTQCGIHTGEESASGTRQMVLTALTVVSRSLTSAREAAGSVCQIWLNTGNAGAVTQLITWPAPLYTFMASAKNAAGAGPLMRPTMIVPADNAPTLTMSTAKVLRL